MSMEVARSKSVNTREKQQRITLKQKLEILDKLEKFVKEKNFMAEYKVGYSTTDNTKCAKEKFGSGDGRSKYLRSNSPTSECVMEG